MKIPKVINISYKAGGIVWVETPTGPEILLRKSSNPDFGGPDWQLGKGGRQHYRFVVAMNDGTKRIVHDAMLPPEKCAIRECKEELGIIPNNIAEMEECFEERRNVEAGLEYITWFLIKMHNKRLRKHDYETSEVAWFTTDEAEKVIRRRQKKVLVALRKRYGF